MLQNILPTQGQTPFTQRSLRITFRLLNNAFGPQGQDTVVLKGLRATVDMTEAQFPSAQSATLRLYGLQPDLMNRLSLAAPDLDVQNASEVMVETQDSQGITALVFQGGVTVAYADYSTAPDIGFVVQAFSTVLPNALVVPPTSFRGAVPASQVLGAIAAKAGLGFVNNGVQTVFQAPYLYGSPGQQLAQCLETHPMRMAIGRGQLTIWPATQVGQGANQTEEQPVTLSAQTGLIGYPSWSAGGLAFRMLFQPQVGFHTLIALQSRYQPAGWGAATNTAAPTGVWRVVQAHHSLQTQQPNGAWFTDIVAQAVS